MLNLALLAGLFGVGLIVIFLLMSYLKAWHFEDPVQDIVLTLAAAALTYYALKLGGVIFSILSIFGLITSAHDLYWTWQKKPEKKLNLLKIKR